MSGNLVCVGVFSRSKLDLKPAFANILKCLSVFDTLFLVNVDMKPNIYWTFHLKFKHYWMPLAICTTEHVQGCIMWMYSLPYIMPTPYYAIDPYVSPFLLPMTLCSLTGKCAIKSMLFFSKITPQMFLRKRLQRYCSGHWEIFQHLQTFFKKYGNFILQAIISIIKGCWLQGSVWNGKGYIIIIILFSSLFNLIKFFEYQTVYSEIQDEETNKT